MKNLPFVLLLAAVFPLIFVVSCGLDLNGGKCEISTAGVCIDLSDSLSNQDANSACLNYFNSFAGSGTMVFLAGSDNACSTSSLLGTCTVSDGRINYYSGGNFNTGTAETDCTSRSGSWLTNS